MLHELAHLVLRQDAICDLDDEKPRAAADLRVEALCNHVAGATLVPKSHLLGKEVVASTHTRREWPEEAIASLAREYWVSREVVLRRLLILGLTSQAFYRETRRVSARVCFSGKESRLRNPGSDRDEHRW